ncbi:MAG: methyltransferase domain-containing protein [Anaerolineales bacterium]
MDHQRQIKEEFSRQANTFSDAAALTDSGVVDRIHSAAGLGDKLRVLDVGCGPGIVTEALAGDGHGMIALDITPEMVHRARQRCQDSGFFNVHYIIGQAEKLPFEEASFNAVVTRLTIHHFADPGVECSDMARITRSKGRLIVADIISSENAGESELHNALEKLRDPSHVSMISSNAMKDLVETTGLKIIQEDHWTMQREFGEWMQIVNSRARAEPLYIVMSSFAKAGIEAGIDIKFNGRTVYFKHHWILLVAEKY